MNNIDILRNCKRVIEFLLGAKIYGYPSTIIQIIPEGKREQAWFSYLSVIRSIIEKYHVDLILDVGANKGQFALKMRRFYKGPIISFEPVSRIFTVLKNTTAHDKNWFKFNYALGNESGEQSINVCERDELSSLLETKKDYIKKFGDGEDLPVKELIQIRRFDDITDEMPFNINSRKILLKMDTQGYDLEVFRGARSIRENIVAIQSEVYQTPRYSQTPLWTENINEYEKAGFKLAGLYPVTRDGFYFMSSDCLMVK